MNNIDFKEEISKFIFTSKYARYNEALGRRETWEETCDRVLNMHLKKFSHLDESYKEEIKWAFSMVKEKKIVPSMRSMQFGGLAVEAHNSRIYNCSVRHVDSIRSFAEIFYLLLCGCGVGVGLSKFFLSRLPDLVRNKDKTGSVITYVVEDNIEGWADSIEALLNCYFRNTAYTGRKIIFDYSRIRPEGAPLKTGGGKAPGYKGLQLTHLKIKELLDHLIEDLKITRLRPIHAYDIIMHTANAVLSGGIRRSATSIVFDADDEEMMEAKTFFTVDKINRFALDEEDNKYYGQVKINKKTYEVELLSIEYEELKKSKKISWIHVEPQRARSNNSVLLLRDKVTKKQLEDINKKTQQFGEPGFVFANNLRSLYNPCITGDSKIYTTEGYIPIENLVGKEIDVYCYDDNHRITVSRMSNIQKTGENKKIYKLELSNGKVLKATPDHLILLETGEYKTIEDLNINDVLLSYDFSSDGSLRITTINVTGFSFCGCEDVYDGVVEKYHNFALEANIFVHNCFEVGFIPVTEDGQCGVQFCNLSSINGAKVNSKDDFIQAAKAAAIIGTLQATYTNFHYLGPVSKQLTEQEALLGVSITGIMDNPKVLLNEDYLQEGAHRVIVTNKKWSKILGIREASRVTVVKPEGTSSLVLGSASGIHPHHAYKYFRRVQSNVLENVYKFFKTFNPHMCEKSVWAANKKDEVVTFPVIVSDQCIVKENLSAIEHLKIIKKVQENWVLAGINSINKKEITHNVSCTVIVKPEEWNEVIDYIYANRNYFGAVALISFSGDKDYKQAPLEAVVTEEDKIKFDELIKNFKPVDYTQLKEKEDVTELVKEVSCGGGTCEVIY